MMIRIKILTKLLISVCGIDLTVQQEDSIIWTYGIVAGHGSEDHNGWSYRIMVMKTGFIIAITQWHGKCIHITGRFPAWWTEEKEHTTNNQHTGWVNWKICHIV